MKTYGSIERLSFQPKFHYCDKVLTGNWYEEKLKYVPNRYNHCTVYVNDFPKKEASFENTDIFWTNKITSQYARVRDLMDEQVKDNFVTTYNISFNILPKTKGAAPRKYSRAFHTYLPQQDFNKQYGNMQYGINQMKYYEIKYEELKSPWSSETNFSYQKPKLGTYTIKRTAIPRKFSSALCNANLQNIHLPFRDLRVSVVPDVVPDFQARAYPHFYF